MKELGSTRLKRPGSRNKLWHMTVIAATHASPGLLLLLSFAASQDEAVIACDTASLALDWSVGASATLGFNSSAPRACESRFRAPPLVAPPCHSPNSLSQPQDPQDGSSGTHRFAEVPSRLPCFLGIMSFATPTEISDARSKGLGGPGSVWWDAASHRGLAHHHPGLEA